MLQHEHEQRLRLEEMVEQLAKQHSHLEQVAKEAAAHSSGMVTSGKQLTARGKAKCFVNSGGSIFPEVCLI